MVNNESLIAVFASSINRIGFFLKIPLGVEPGDFLFEAIIAGEIDSELDVVAFRLGPAVVVTVASRLDFVTELIQVLAQLGIDLSVEMLPVLAYALLEPGELGNLGNPAQVNVTGRLVIDEVVKLIG